jgi:F0F1-type ATP synthase delta subunit
MTKIARTELAEALAERTLHMDDPKLLAKEIAAYLLIENRTADLQSLVRDIMQYRMDKGMVEAVALSAHELGEQVLDDVRVVLEQEFPDSKTVIVRERRDPDLVGGVRVKMANDQLDMSVQAKISRFKRLIATERST